MKNKTTILTTIVCIIPILLGVLLYEKLPETIAVHFDSSGGENGFLPKSLVVFGLPFLFAALNLFMHFRIYSDPKKSNISPITKSLLQWVAPLTSVIIIPITLFLALGMSLPTLLIVQLMLGVCVLAMGNYFPKCKKNYTVGIRIPWTLNSDDNWFKTHRFSGFLWTICGFILIINAIFSISIYITISAVSLLIILPFIYSFTIYQKSKQTL